MSSTHEQKKQTLLALCKATKLLVAKNKSEDDVVYYWDDAIFQPVVVLPVEELADDVYSRKNTLSYTCNIFLQVVLIVLMSTCLFGAVLMQSPAPDAAAPTIVHKLKRVLKVVPQVVERMPQGMPVDVSLLMRKSLFNRNLREIMKHNLPTPALASTHFEGALPLSTAVVPAASRVDTKVSSHVAVPVETYTQWMLFMHSMSVVKRVQETKTTAPACVCPRDDAKDANNTSKASKDVQVHTTGELLWNGACAGMAVVGSAVTVALVGTLIAGLTGFGSE